MLKIMEKEKQENLYAQIIGSAIQDLFSGDGDYHIDLEELQEGENMTHFFHALSNLVPTQLYNNFTEEDVNILEYNHIANQMCFQYGKKIDDE